MKQTRNFLLFALLAVAYFLFMAWEKDYLQPPAPPATAAAASAATVPNAQVPTAQVPSAPPVAGAAPTVANTANPGAPTPLITVDTDVLHLTIDTRGGSIVRAKLLDYLVKPRTHKDPHPAP
ncbi:MAG TPA: membrane protein insertase YidC, partial [Rhodanobacter sp.]|nr:membrane protein insertase YidC [Rhodanobacter sp.]